MTDKEVKEFIEGTGPVLDAVFPDWAKGHREALMMMLVTQAQEYERDTNAIRARVGMDSL